MCIGFDTYLVNVSLAECNSKMSFLELPLLVIFIARRISCKAPVQPELLAGSTAPNAPIFEQHRSSEQLW